MNEQPEWLKAYVFGEMHSNKVLVYLDGINYAIIKRPGGSYWDGMTGMNYCPVQYVLIKKDGKRAWHATTKLVHEGRLNKADKLKLKYVLYNAEN